MSKSKISREMDTAAIERMESSLRSALSGVTGRLRVSYAGLLAGRREYESGKSIDLAIRDSMFRMGWALRVDPGRIDYYVKGDDEQQAVDVDVSLSLRRIHEPRIAAIATAPVQRCMRTPVRVVISFSDGTAENMNPFETGVEHLFGFNGSSFTAFVADVTEAPSLGGSDVSSEVMF